MPRSLSPLQNAVAFCDGSNDGRRDDETCDLSDAEAALVVLCNLSSLSVSYSACRSTAFHSSHRMPIRPRIIGFRASSGFSRTSVVRCSAWSFPAETPSSVREESACFVNDCRAPRNEPVTTSMHCLQIELVVGPDRNETHALVFNRFGDGLPCQRSLSCWTLQVCANVFGFWVEIVSPDQDKMRTCHSL